MKKTILAIILPAALFAAPPAAPATDGKTPGAPKVTVTCTRASHRYTAEESAEFLVDAQAPGTEVVVRFARVGREPLTEFVTTTPARVSYALGKPGFVRCLARRKGVSGEFAVAGASFDPEQLRPSLPPPADYDQFWENAFKELESIPADYEKRPIAKGVYALSCRTVNGKRQYGFLRLPEGPGPYPLKVWVSGGEAYITEQNVLGGEPKGQASLAIHLPPYRPAARDGKEHHAKWLKEHGLRRFIFENIDKEPRDLYFYPCILGACRLLDLVMKEPSIDRARVIYSGASHGGGFGVYITAFSPHIKAAFCGVPNFGNLSGTAEGRPIGISDGPLRGIWQKLRYFDAAYCAPRITVPVFMSVGYLDTAVEADSIYPVYNALRGPKLMFDKVNYGHGGGPPEYQPLVNAWLSNVLK